MTNSGAGDVPADLVNIPCPLCGTLPFRPLYTVRDRLDPNVAQAKSPPQDKTYQIVTCSSCGFLYLNPRPTAWELQRYYQTESYDPHRRRGGGAVGHLFRLMRPLSIRWKEAKVNKAKTKGILLDIGCGTGEFLRHMSDCGWDSIGVEMDEKAAKAAESIGCTVIVGDPAEVHLPESNFDLITLWHSLEHLPGLTGTADNISAALKSGGKLAVALPNPDSLDARHYGARWAAWDAPRHLYHFRPRDLQALMQPRGLQLIKMWSLPLDPFYHCLLSESRGSAEWSTGIRAVRGLLLGILSFFAGLRPGKGSSTLYLFVKS